MYDHGNISDFFMHKYTLWIVKIRDKCYMAKDSGFKLKRA